MLLKEEYATIVALLKHPALAGMGAIGRDAAALADKVSAEATTPAAVVSAPTKPSKLKQIEQAIEAVFEEQPETKDNVS